MRIRREFAGQTGGAARIDGDGGTVDRFAVEITAARAAFLQYHGGAQHGLLLDDGHALPDGDVLHVDHHDVLRGGRVDRPVVEDLLGLGHHLELELVAPVVYVVPL